MSDQRAGAHKKRLRFVVVQPGDEEAPGSATFLFLSGIYEKDRERLFAKAFSDSTWGSCFKQRVELGNFL